MVLKPGSNILVGLITRSQLEVILSLEESVLLTDADSWLVQSSEPEWWHQEMLNIKAPMPHPSPNPLRGSM